VPDEYHYLLWYFMLEILVYFKHTNTSKHWYTLSTRFLLFVENSCICASLSICKAQEA
jgi:hypothetical protein